MKAKKHNVTNISIRLKSGLYLTGISLLSALLYFIDGSRSVKIGNILPKKQSTTTLLQQINRETHIQNACIDINWITWSTITKSSAIGTIANAGTNISVTMAYDFEFEIIQEMEHYGAFKGFNAPVPNAALPRTSWSKEPQGITTICFSEAVKEPVLLLASLGSFKALTTLNFSEPYVIFYNSGGIKIDNNTTLTGRNGYGIIKFPGEIKCIKIISSGYENFADLTLGIAACPDGTPKPKAEILAVKQVKKKKIVEEPKLQPIKPEPLIIAAVKPEPIIKPIAETPKVAPVVAAVKPKPIVEPIAEIPKVAPVVIAEKPKPIIETPKVAAVKPKPIVEPIAEIMKVVPVVIADIKPKPIIETPKDVVIKPKPLVEKQKVVPVVIADIKPKPIIETPKAVSAIAVFNPEPIPKIIKPTAPLIVIEKKVIKTITPLSTPVVSTKSKFLKIEIWDYSGMDYDSVSLTLNGKQIGPKNIELKLEKKNGNPEYTYLLGLGPGNNILEVYAVSEGLKPFTTICVQVGYEDKPKKIFISMKAKETRTIQL